MMDLRVIFVGALAAATGCIIIDGSGSASDGQSSTGGASGESSGGTTSGGSTTEASATEASATGGSTSSSPTSGAPTSGATTGAPVEYCNGFDQAASEPFLDVKVMNGTPVGDGVVWPLECGGQGFWMFGLYPSLGGWDPGSDSVVFSITVDVEGFNNNPDGHFYSNTQEYYYIGCELLDGGVTGVIGVIPPDVIADLTALDGKPATLHIEISGGGQLLGVDATMTLSAPMDVVQGGCMPF